LKKKAAALACSLVLAAAGSFCGMAGEWERSEDGKYWTYCDSPGNPREDEWIEDNGKIYYVDSKGRMKTGWVTDEDSGNKYYMGEDGAMCFNAFTKDDRYVGPDGLRVEAYDTYRKAVKSEIKKAGKKKTKSTKKISQTNTGQGEDVSQSYFLLTDLNLDGYRDLVMMEGTEERKSLVEVAIWDAEEEEFLLSAEFDEPEEGMAVSTLYQDPLGDTVWLEMAEPNGDLHLFQMEDQEARFKSMWSFEMELDDWGGPEYRVNGVLQDKDEWDYELAEARRSRGENVLGGYLPATEENIKAQVDKVLTEEELEMW
jgi:hypothetical protein